MPSLAKYLALLWPLSRINQTPISTPPHSSLSFRHQHAFIASPDLPRALSSAATPPQILFNDHLVVPDLQTQAIRELTEDYTAAGREPHHLKSHRQKIHRLRHPEKLQEARLRALRSSQTAALDWDEVDIEMPDVTDRLTVLELAKLTGNAYAIPDSRGWYDTGGKWNKSEPFGWEESENGFRGNIFVSEDNSTVVLSIKGTSLVGQGPTAGRDKLNDNRLFSCCCARVSHSWAFSTVCDCYSGSWACTQSCLEQSLQDDDLYYNIGINLYNNLTYMYPQSTIWIVGHSLGGGLSGLLGATFGAPTVTFEALGDRLPAQRLHLPSPPVPEGVSAEEAFSLHPITHIYHTADPVPHGACTGVRSLCAKGGYALEARCHLGRTIVYDTITKFKWSQALIHHPIAVMIGKILAEDWDADGLAVPEAIPQTECVDCHKWDYLDD
ncbi:Putative lipase ATG15; AltName: Full=Autophagy-related protein 15 [Serendipita indica DSM 11827]|uniref:triacylglycerol lipase n=1 Tax=Serendipita indica (strain DSM 11827) TaxID=1109443 RepID=G4TEA9_SERID|nr:Putative lipase ATG15; AltName: Full=Autophagy-related protein 15 [Serendipita indica DSM 11827]CCA69652.1 related to Lipase, required for intravacuolar lysis of autophagic bodies [Serendipita indica DSM 11827]